MLNKGNINLLMVGVIAIVIFLGVSSLSSAGGQTAGVWDAVKSLFGSGNGAPSGEHYNLNIIAVANPKNTDMSGVDNVCTGAHRIFVSLGGYKPLLPVTTKINLSMSTDGTYCVTDGNGTDGVAGFKLPAPGSYSIWARPLGKPGGESKVTTCATYTYTDPDTGQTVTEDVCSTSNELFVRNSGKSSFRNVTATLTTIDLDSSLTDVIAACGDRTTVSLFDACLEGYFWKNENNGLKLLQLRFYPN